MEGDGAPGDRAKRLRLRYAGACRSCGVALAAGETAVYERDRKTVVCLACATVKAAQDGLGAHDGTTVSTRLTSDGPTAVEQAAMTAGSAGASAQREYERRKNKREERVRAAHPTIGGFLLAISEEPQSTRAWATGARGEEVLGRRLDGLGNRGVRVLHDRRIPRTRANIDHIAVAAAGVFVIDAKRYKGRPELRVEGGLLRPRVEKLLVHGRDQTALVGGVRRQVDLVRAALVAAQLSEVPVHGVLCFVEADWPLIGGSFVVDGVGVLWPKKLADQLTGAGPIDTPTIDRAQRSIAAAFPPA